MRLNNLEFLAMINPIRALHQDLFEMPFLRKASRLAPGARVLEIGCGSGAGTAYIRKYFAPDRIEAVDLDPRMIRIARFWHRHPSVNFGLADAVRLPFGAAEFDAVFDLGIIHHIPEWRRGIDEVRRVLKPGGEFLFNELCTESFLSRLGPWVKRVTDHPYAEMFSSIGFRDYLASSGFDCPVPSRIPVYAIIDLFSAVAVKKAAA